jgi:hypothetical protein
MSCEDYIVGQRPQLDFQIRDNRVLTDPTTLVFMFRKPNDSATTTYVWGTDAQLVRDSVGKFHVELSLDQAGIWSWRQQSTGVVTASQGTFNVAAALL